MMAPIEFGRTA